MVRSLAAALVVVLSSQFVFSQEVINNLVFPDVDFSYNVVDTGMLKNKLKNKICYQCSTESFNKDSCTVRSKQIYDIKGRLIEYINTCDSNRRNCIAIQARIKKQSDTLYEVVTLYPKNSDAIPGTYYRDTLIKGIAKRLHLYKRDRDENMFVRSVYLLDLSGSLIKIERYDVGNKLVQVFYPLGNRSALSESTETLVTDMDSVIAFRYQYKENEVLRRYIYSKNGNISLVVNEDKAFDSHRKSVVSTRFFYNSNNQLIRKITVDEDSHVISEESFNYVAGRLVRFSEDDNFEDSLEREEKRYDKYERLVSYRSYNQYNGTVFTRKYIYNTYNLLEKEIFYADDKIEYTLIYVYN